MTEQKKSRMARTLFRLGLVLLLFPWIVFLSLRVLIEFVGQEAVEGMAVMLSTVYFLVAVPAGMGLLVASFFVFLRERFGSEHSR